MVTNVFDSTSVQNSSCRLKSSERASPAVIVETALLGSRNQTSPLHDVTSYSVLFSFLLQKLLILQVCTGVHWWHFSPVKEKGLGFDSS